MRKAAYFLLAFLMSCVFAADRGEPILLSADDKGVMLIFESKDCEYCERLKLDLEENAELTNLAKDFNVYRIDVNENNEYALRDQKNVKDTLALRLALEAKEIPNVVIFDKYWNKIFQLPGYASPAQMSVFMRFVKGLNEGQYKIEQWREYLSQNGIL